MAKQSGRRLVSRALEQADRPIYLVDAEYRIVFCNESCLKWLNVAEQEVFGQTCHFHASSADALTPWSGLGPPPLGFERETTDGLVCGLCDGTRRYRTACFERIVDPEGEVLVMGILAATDVDPTDHLDHLDSSQPVLLHNRLLSMRYELGDVEPLLLGHSPSVHRAREQVQLAKTASQNLLVIARVATDALRVAQHVLSSRSAASSVDWFAVDCKLLDAELLQAALDAARKQLVDQTLSVLFKQVDELSTDAQHMLCSYLRDHQLVAVATTTTDLLQLESFDEMLANLMEVVRIDVPALVDRVQDLPVVIQSVVESLNLRPRRIQVEGMDDEAIDLLTSHRWTGGYEELHTVVDEAHAACQGSLIRATDLPSRIHLTAEADRFPNDHVAAEVCLDDFLRNIESELIQRALREAAGNRAEAARRLGISRARLLRRLKDLSDEHDS